MLNNILFPLNLIITLLSNEIPKVLNIVTINEPQIVNIFVPHMFISILLFFFLLFFIAFFGVGVYNKNLLNILVCLEIMMLVPILIYLFTSYFFFDLAAHVYALVVLAMAAADSALGLAFLILYYFSFQTIVIKDIHGLRG